MQHTQQTATRIAQTVGEVERTRFLQTDRRPIDRPITNRPPTRPTDKLIQVYPEIIFWGNKKSITCTN